MEVDELWADSAPCCVSYWATIALIGGRAERLSLRDRVLEPLLVAPELESGLRYDMSQQANSSLPPAKKIEEAGHVHEVTLLTRCEAIRVLFDTPTTHLVGK